jgi:hypothetical protein
MAYDRLLGTRILAFHHRLKAQGTRQAHELTSSLPMGYLNRRRKYNTEATMIGTLVTMSTIMNGSIIVVLLFVFPFYLFFCIF